VHGKSSSLERTPEIQGAHEASIAICLDGASLGKQGALSKVVPRPTREHEDLETVETVGLFDKQGAKPLHAVFIALH
jgi:hypothetical protein